MNIYDLNSYEKTYHDPHYWDGESSDDDAIRHSAWVDCRALTDRFFDELVSRGYLVPCNNTKY